MNIFKNIFQGIRGFKVGRIFTKRPVATSAPKSSQPIQYLLSDMLMPNLTKLVDSSIKVDRPAFNVRNYKGGGFQRGSVESVAANCYVTICNVLNNFKKYSLIQLNRWTAVSNLTVIPAAGQDLNAFYNRTSLQFFYISHPSLSTTLFLGDSADVVAHELGHAIFDTVRPQAFNAALLEASGAHEGIADFFSMLNALSHPEIIIYVLEQTNGDLRKPNLVSGLCEDTGRVLNQLTGRHGLMCLRNAINDFKYISPSKLPADAPEGQLSAECHSFGQILLGAFYEILVEIYEHALATTKKPIQSLEYARDTLAVLVISAMLNAPLNVKYYESLAKTILWADKTKFAGSNQDLLRKVLLNRNLISDQIKILSDVPKNFGKDKIERKTNTITTKLLNHFVAIQSDNPLYNVSVEIPNDEALFYDDAGNCIDFCSVSNEEALQGGQEMICHLHAGKKVSDDPLSPFRIENDKLVRNCFF